MEYLYHYTTIDKLALILKNRKIRFNSLDKMDDLQENMTIDVENFGKLFFASSWTEQKKESIPMWKMYAPIEKGVRIGLPKNPFKRYPKYITDKNTGEIIKDYYFIPTEIWRQKGLYTPQYKSSNLLVKVTYSDDKGALVPKVLSDEGYTLFLDMFGKIKNTYWKFQKEWRYLVYFLKIKEEVPRFFNELRNGNVTLPFEYFDLEIADNCFNAMEILMSPKISEGNQILLEALKKEYNPCAKLMESRLKGKI